MAGVFLFFALGLAGVGILAAGACCARSKAAVIGWGVLGAVFLGLECALVAFASKFGSAFSGDTTGTRVVVFAVLFSLAALVIYFLRLLGK